MKNKQKSLLYSVSYVVKMSEWLGYALLKLRLRIHLNKWNNRQNNRRRGKVDVLTDTFVQEILALLCFEFIYCAVIMQASDCRIFSKHISNNRPRIPRTCFWHWLPLPPISHRLVSCLTTDEEFEALRGGRKALQNVRSSHTRCLSVSVSHTQTHFTAMHKFRVLDRRGD